MTIRWGTTLALLLALSLRARPGSADDLSLWMPLGSVAPADALAQTGKHPGTRLCDAGGQSADGSARDPPPL